MGITNTYLDKFFVRNLTGRTVTLGDLVNLSIPPRKRIDLLSVARVTKEKINQSQSLNDAISAGFLKLEKHKHKKLKKAVLGNECKILETVGETLFTKGIYISSPSATEEIPLWLTTGSTKLTRIFGITDAGTLTFNLEERDIDTPFTSGTDISDTSIVADTNGETQSGFNVQTIGSDKWIVLVSSAVSGSPTKFNLNIDYLLPKTC